MLFQALGGTPHESFQNLPWLRSRSRRNRALRRPCRAHADTYEIFDLGGSVIGSTTPIGITASGTVVLVYNLPPGAPLCEISHICQEYETWVNGVMVNYSPTAPNLVYDNGTPCTVSAPFLTFPVPGTCNNGHEVYSAPTDAPYPYASDTFTGQDP